MKIKIAQTSSDFLIAKKLFLEYQTKIDVCLCFQSFEDELKILSKIYKKPEGVLFLIEEKNKFIGCVGVRKFEDGICELKRMYIKQEFRGKGFGEILLLSAIKESKKLGYIKMRLDTLKTMFEAIGLYQKFGFKKIRKYYRNNIKNIVYLEKFLTKETE